jgi:O-methyltransferase
MEALVAARKKCTSIIANNRKEWDRPCIRRGVCFLFQPKIRTVTSSGFGISAIIKGLRRIVRSTGFDLIRYRQDDRVDISPDYDEMIVETIRYVRPFTQTSPQRIASLCDAIRYITAAQIPGDIVECGVWRGGSMMAVGRTLIETGDTARDLFLYDTFEGMPQPSERDITYSGTSASTLMHQGRKDDPFSIWCYAPLETVKGLLYGVGYPREKIHFVQGKVEDTIPQVVPERIALLRLDTDWYESTHHELIHLFPRLSRGGVLIVDDYGHWQGARQAVDDYLAEFGAKLLLNRIDYTGRIAIKVFD